MRRALMSLVGSALFAASCNTSDPAAIPRPVTRTPAVVTAPVPTPTVAPKAPVQKTIDDCVLYIAGHTANTENKGALSATGIREHRYNDAMVSAIKALPEASAASYILSGSDLPVKNRPAFAATRQSCLYIEVHHDSGQPRDIERKAWDELSGYSVFYSRNGPHAEESARLATAIGSAMRARGLTPTTYHSKDVPGERKILVDKENGVYEADFYVLANASMPAVIVECGNIVNPKEEATLSTARAKTAAAIRQGVDSYLRD